jgi:hypothetical protein
MGAMTWSRRVSSAADGARGPRRNPVAARASGLVEELFAAKFAQVVPRLADGVLGVGCAGYRVELVGEVADGESGRRRHQRQGGAQCVPHPLFVQVDTADVGGTEPGAGGQLVEHAAGEVSSVHTVQRGGESFGDPGQPDAISGNLSSIRPHRSSAVLCAIASNRSTRSPYLCWGPP